MDIMQAEVVGRDLITWDKRVQNAWLVVYRGDPGSDAARAGKEHAWLWVRDDGVVIQHRIAALDGSLTFVRMPDARRRELQHLFLATRNGLPREGLPQSTPPTQPTPK